jgi:hypothetical protein
MEMCDYMNIMASLSPVPIELEAGWAPQLVTILGEKKDLLPWQESTHGSLVVYPVSSHYTNYTILAPTFMQQMT